jgi:hypothetical protein
MAALPCSMLFTDNSHAEAANPKLNHLPEHSPKSSSRHLRGVIHELEGDVFINKNIANLSSIIQSGDRVSVAYGARLIFSMADDTYLLQEASSLELVSHNDIAISGLRLLTGGLLSVFGPRETPTNIYTRTAVIGIRGTGVYLNSQPEKLYFCTCYGKTDLHLGRHHTEHIEATHHHAFDITGNTQNTMTMQATQVIGHSDDELRRLEHYSGRKPSFDL